MIEEIGKREKYFKETIRFNIFKFFLMMLKNLKQEKPKTQNIKIVRALGLIEENYFRKISIEESTR